MKPEREEWERTMVIMRKVYDKMTADELEDYAEVFGVLHDMLVKMAVLKEAGVSSAKIKAGFEGV